MRTYSLKLFGVLVVVAAVSVLVGHGSSATADDPYLGLTALDESTLEIDVEPSVVGGHGDLYRTIEGQSDYVMTFGIAAPQSIIPIPGGPADAYWYAAFDAGGGSSGSSDAIAPFEPEPIPEH